MIRFIAAIDSKRGIADEHGLPWQGRIPLDIQWYLNNIETGTILMGYGLYKELSRKPYGKGINYVATRTTRPLRKGFQAITDAREFLESRSKDEHIWNIGGAQLYTSTLDLADELYLTELEGDFKCTKFFPEFKDQFKCTWQSDPITQDGITFRFKIYARA